MHQLYVFTFSTLTLRLVGLTAAALVLLCLAGIELSRSRRLAFILLPLVLLGLAVFGYSVIALDVAAR